MRSRKKDPTLVIANNNRGVGNYSYLRGKRETRGEQEPISKAEEAWARQLSWFLKARRNFLKAPRNS